MLQIKKKFFHASSEDTCFRNIYEKSWSPSFSQSLSFSYITHDNLAHQGLKTAWGSCAHDPVPKAALSTDAVWSFLPWIFLPGEFSAWEVLPIPFDLRKCCWSFRLPFTGLPFLSCVLHALPIAFCLCSGQVLSWEFPGSLLPEPQRRSAAVMTGVGEHTGQCLGLPQEAHHMHSRHFFTLPCNCFCAFLLLSWMIASWRTFASSVC